MRLFGIPRICYAPEGGGGGGDNNQQQQQASAAFTPPWGSDVNQMWMIDGKPWFDVAIPEGPAREHAREKQYKNPVVVTDSLYNANKLMRMDTRVPIPDFNTAKPEDINAYYDKRGRLANPDAYDIKAPDGKKWDDNLVKFGKTIAHELGLHPKEAATLVTKYDEFATQHLDAIATAEKAANEQAVKALETQYGDDLAANKEAGLRVMRSLDLPETVLQGLEKAIGLAPVIDILVRLGKKGAEGGSFKGGEGGDNATDNTPEGAASKIEQLRGDAAFMAKFNNANAPGHKEAVAEMEKLYSRAGSKAA